MCGLELLLCCAVGAGGVYAWQKRGALLHNGKVVIDQQGRVMGKDGKLLRDKQGNFVFINDKENKKGGKKGADSGETVRGGPGNRKQAAAGGKPPVAGSKQAAAPAEKKHGFFSHAKKDPGAIPVTRRNVGRSKNGSGDWDADTLAQFQASKNK